MTDLLAQVTPLTKGIIWLTGGNISPHKNFYKEIDYLLNGLLTATLTSQPDLSHVLLAENFGQSFYVFAGSNAKAKDVDNFLELIKSQLEAENNVLLIDENDSFKELKKSIPIEFQNKIQMIQ
jgi:SRSO17 transposase